ncbi:hypothetical protein [Halobellus ordinarius]|jgi:hypothetical protein|nr:hypothetical protein [Halobellus sp. ZY16]
MNVSEYADYGSNTEKSTCFHGSDQAVRKRRNHPKMGNPEQEGDERHSNE